MSFFSKWINKIQTLLVPEVTKTFEEFQVEVAVIEAKTAPAPAPAAVEKAKGQPSKKSSPNVELAGKRTRKNGKFVADDKSTPNVNEAFIDGKAPVKKAPKKKPNIKIAK